MTAKSEIIWGVNEMGSLMIWPGFCWRTPAQIPNDIEFSNVGKCQYDIDDAFDSFPAFCGFERLWTHKLVSVLDSKSHTQLFILFLKKKIKNKTWENILKHALFKVAFCTSKYTMSPICSSELLL